MKATPQQLQRIHAALHMQGLLHHKADMVSSFTNGRSESSREMTSDEAAELLQMLNETQSAKQKEQGTKDKMVRHMIAMAHEMGWIKERAVVNGDGQVSRKKDYTDLHAWVEKYGYLKKPLNKYSYQELPTLVTAFKNVYTSWLKRK